MEFLSLDGGIFPRWTDGGRELRYLNLERRERIAVRVGGGEDLEPGTPQKAGDMVEDTTSGTMLGDDGSRLVSVAIDRRPRDIRIIVNWTALLER